MQVPPIPHLVTLPHKVIMILELTATNISLIEKKFNYGVFFFSQLREKLAKENRKS